MKVLALIAVAGTSLSAPLHEQVIDLLREQREPVTNVLPAIHPKRMTFNPEAPVPPQCYTRTEGRFNPCYVCHQDPMPGRENTLADGALQTEYAFSDVGVTNHWTNLFEDRSSAVSYTHLTLPTSFLV